MAVGLSEPRILLIMQNHLVITALGTYADNLVEQFSAAIKDCGCNIVDGRMTTMGSEFTMSVMLSGSWDSIAKMESVLKKLEDRLSLIITVKRTEMTKSSNDLMPYAIDVVSFDHTGVVNDIAKFISNNNIIIQDMYTNSYPAAHTGTPMFSLHMTINIPTDISIASLRGDFMEFCDKLNLDAIMEPVK